MRDELPARLVVAAVPEQATHIRIRICNDCDTDLYAAALHPLRGCFACLLKAGRSGRRAKLFSNNVHTIATRRKGLFPRMPRIFVKKKPGLSHPKDFGVSDGEGAPGTARQLPLPTTLRDLLRYMCCDVCALLLGGSRHHTPAGGIRRFRDAGVSHPDEFGACKLLGPASLYHHGPFARFRRPAASGLASDSYVWLPAG